MGVLLIPEQNKYSICIENYCELASFFELFSQVVLFM